MSMGQGLVSDNQTRMGKSYPSMIATTTEQDSADVKMFPPSNSTPDRSRMYAGK